MPFLHQFGEELQEEREHQQANMHAVHIGIGSDNHLVVSELIESFFDIERRLQAVELLVFIHHFLGEAIRVERLTAEGENGLGVHITALGDTARCGETLGDENGALVTQIDLRTFARVLRFGIVEMHTAVAQFGVIQEVLLSALASQLRNARNRLALLL